MTEPIRHVTVWLVEGIADAFAHFIDRYGRFFRTKTRDSAAVAARYLRGLVQAEDGTFASMATVVNQGCAQQFQHFLSVIRLGNTNRFWLRSARTPTACWEASRPAR
jgi:hypothetical protein